MAKKLGIGLGDIPTFLEDYGDIFLSLSYYRQALDEIEQVIAEFLDSMDEIRSNWQLKQDQNLMRTCTMLQSTINELMAEITGRFENFEQGTKDLWNDISAKRFERGKKPDRKLPHHHRRCAVRPKRQNRRLAPLVPQQMCGWPGQAS